ncbi:hypothetical protein JCM14469_15910 [Desulfatiferula olefinivorans]
MNKRLYPVQGLALIMTALFGLASTALSCDIAVVSAKVTSNNRPLIWKSRDNSLGWEQEIASYKRSKNYDNPAAGGSIRVVDRTRGTAAQSGGANESGFAITNTTVYQESPIHEYLASANLNLMSNALTRCVTVDDFDDYLAEWHTISSNRTRILSGNFVVIDAYGGAALYELTTGESSTDIYAYGGRVKIHKIDANTGFVTNEDGALIGNNGEIGWITNFAALGGVQVMDIERRIINTDYRIGIDGASIVDAAGNVIDNGENFCGIINRTNSSFWIKLNDDTPREDRAMDMMLELKAQGRLNFQTVLQEVARDVEIDAYDLAAYPGLSNRDDGTATERSTFHTISRFCTNLAFVVDGVEPRTRPDLITMWVNLGEPSVGTAIPFFPAADAISDYGWADAKFLSFYLDLSPTCYLNQAIVDERNTLYDNNGDQNILALLPPIDITGQLFLDLLQVNWLFNSTEDAWSDFEGALSDWHVLWLDYMAGQDEGDKTIYLPGLYEIQSWSIPLENLVLDQTARYLDAMRQDPSRISQSNLLTFSNYCTEFVYTNYTQRSASYQTWSFTYPWNKTATTSTSLFRRIFWWL